MSISPRALAVVVVLAVAAPAVWAALVALRVYRFESAFYRPPRRTPPRPSEPSGLREASFEVPGARLNAWYLAPREAPGAAVVLAHGSGADRAQLAPQAALLARHGYGVLLFDWPGHGDSGGRVEYGRAESDALRAALAWLAARPEVAPTRIGGLGCSLGAYFMLLGGATDERLRAVVAEAAPVDLVSATRHQYRRSAPVGPWAALLAARRAGVDLGTTDALAVVARLAPRALLLIAGDRDDAVPGAMAERLFAAAREPKDLWIVPGAGHCEALARAPSEYETRVAAFFEQALRAERAP